MIKPMLIGIGIFLVLGLAGLPVLNYLPLLLLLACPLMMVFMMAGMNHRYGRPCEPHDDANTDRDPRSEER
jgi:Protein of unknown function (DUF2933)